MRTRDRPGRRRAGGAVHRAALRLGGFGLIVLAAFLDWGWSYAKHRGTWPRKQSARWLSRWSWRTLRWLNVRVTARGTPPERGMLVSNHLSYLDVLVFASLHPAIFVAKADVRHWPIFGWLARLAGTLFIRRERPGDVARLNQELAPAVLAGDVVALFPEGTSSGGQAVGIFYSALLAPAADEGWPVTPAGIAYELDEGDPAREVCYWGDMVFVPHLLNLLAQKEIRATVVFGSPVSGFPDRKRLARTLREQVQELHGTSLPRPPWRLGASEPAGQLAAGTAG